METVNTDLAAANTGFCASVAWSCSNRHQQHSGICSGMTNIAKHWFLIFIFIKSPAEVVGGRNSNATPAQSPNVMCHTAALEIDWLLTDIYWYKLIRTFLSWTSSRRHLVDNFKTETLIIKLLTWGLKLEVNKKQFLFAKTIPFENLLLTSL